MSEMTFTVRDANRAVHSRQHGSFLELLVAALGAEPETIEELDAALMQFVAPGELRPLARWPAGLCDEPYDAGICIVDLAARLVMTQSTYAAASPSGEVPFAPRGPMEATWLPYHVSADWLFIGQVDAWEGTAESRRHTASRRPGWMPGRCSTAGSLISSLPSALRRGAAGGGQPLDAAAGLVACRRCRNVPRPASPCPRATPWPRSMPAG